jgi:hypothetical protein
MKPSPSSRFSDSQDLYMSVSGGERISRRLWNSTRSSTREEAASSSPVSAWPTVAIARIVKSSTRTQSPSSLGRRDLLAATSASQSISMVAICKPAPTPSQFRIEWVCMMEPRLNDGMMARGCDDLPTHSPVYTNGGWIARSSLMVALKQLQGSTTDYSTPCELDGAAGPPPSSRLGLISRAGSLPR